MTSNNTIVISSQATFFEDRFPRKGKDDENFTKELGRIWEEFNNDPPSNLDNNIPNNHPLDDDGSPRRPDRRGASPGPPQQPDPSGNQDDDNNDSSRSPSPKRESDSDSKSDTDNKKDDEADRWRRMRQRERIEQERKEEYMQKREAFREKQRQEREAYTRDNPSPPPCPITPLDYIDEEPDSEPMETEPTELVDFVERGRDYLQFDFPNFQNRVRE